MSNIKQIIIIVIVISIVVIVDIIMVNNTKSVVKSMNDKLENIDSLLAKEKSPKKEVEELIDEWNEKEKIISCYLEHNEVEKIGGQIYLLEKQIEIEDYDDARQSVKETEVLFDYIKEKQILNIENFF